MSFRCVLCATGGVGGSKNWEKGTIIYYDVISDEGNLYD